MMSIPVSFCLHPCISNTAYICCSADFMRSIQPPCPVGLASLCVLLPWASFNLPNGVCKHVHVLGKARKRSDGWLSVCRCRPQLPAQCGRPRLCHGAALFRVARSLKRIPRAGTQLNPDFFEHRSACEAAVPSVGSGQRNRASTAIIRVYYAE